MSNAELTLEQLQAVSGGANALKKLYEWLEAPWCFPLPSDNSVFGPDAPSVAPTGDGKGCTDRDMPF